MRLRVAEMLRWPWSMQMFSMFLHRIPVVLNIQNTGNVKTAPSKISLELFDITKNKLLESSVKNSIDQVDPFSTKEITTYFRTKLTPGQYWGRVKVYKEETIVNFYEIAFTIAPAGGLPNGAPGLGLYPWLLLAGYIIGAFIIITILMYIRIWRLTGKAVSIFSLAIMRPFVPVVKKIINGAGRAKIGFWRWVGRKASRYDDKNRRDR
jgi:hypothetical protein